MANVEAIERVKKFEDMTEILKKMFEENEVEHGGEFDKLFDVYGYVLTSLKIESKLLKFKKLGMPENGNYSNNNEQLGKCLIDIAQLAIMTLTRLNDGIVSETEEEPVQSMPVTKEKVSVSQEDARRNEEIVKNGPSFIKNSKQANTK